MLGNPSDLGLHLLEPLTGTAGNEGFWELQSTDAWVT